jgi:heat shock protein HslJ
MRILFSLFTLIILTESCNSSKEVIETTTIKNSNNVQNTLSGSYIITQIRNNTSISPKLIISFDNKSNKVTGFAGCNSFFGSYTTQGAGITFSSIASSKKFCGNEINTIEKDFLNALHTANTFTVKNTVLFLLENDTTLLKASKTELSKSDASTTDSTTKSDIVKDNYQTRITYKALARGSFQYSEISKSNIAISTDRNLMQIDNYYCEEKDWEDLNTLIEAVDLETFQKLKAPTEKRFYDGAAHASLAIQLGDVKYMTPTFDHGHPPKEIEALVNKVLSIKENAVKQ